MKKINLIEWLSRNSHEKQSPQRFARYAAILIMLLTLGVGQMWATTYHLAYQKDMPSGNYDASNKVEMTQSSNYSNRYYCEVSLSSSSTYGFFVIKNYTGSNPSGDYYKATGTAYNNQKVKLSKYDGSNYGNSSNRVNFTSGSSTETYIFTFDAGTNEIFVSKKSSETIKISYATASGKDDYYDLGNYTQFSQVGTSANYTLDLDLTAVKYYMFMQLKSSGSTYAYWRGTSTVDINGSAPVYFYKTTNYGDSKDKIQFTPSAAAKYRFTWNHDDKTIKIQRLYNISYQKGDNGTGSTQTDYKVHGTNITLRSSGDFSRTGYNHTAWNTSSTGSGGTSYALGASYTSNANLTLYPTWTAKTTTVTLNGNAPAGQTVTGGGTQVTATYDAALPSFSALTCNGGYALKGYYTETSGGTKVINADGTFAANSGIWNRTDGDGLTLYAQWKLTYTVTYYANYPAGATSTSGSVPTDATEYASGATVTVATNSGSLTAGGFIFAGWNTQADGNGTDRAASSTFSISGNTQLYAKWTENKRNVIISVSKSGAGTLNKTSASVGVATTTTVTATANPGYRFVSWTPTNCSVASTTSASTTLSGNGTSGDATLVANFERTYAYIQGRMTIYNSARNSKTHVASSEGEWDVSSTRIQMNYDETNHLFYLHTYMKPSELSAEQSSNEQYFFFKTSTNSSSLTGTVTTYRPSTGRTLTAAGTENKKATETSTGTNSIWFDSETTNGYAILYFDEAGVWYELEHKLLYNGNGNTGGSTPASSGNYYDNGTNATAATNTYTMSNYSFAGWNTSQHISGTNYAAGASVPMTTNRTLYATWTRSVTLNQEDATTNGSTSVTGTWNCSTLPAITNPEKTGYVFGGWYTETAGKGNLVINTAGELQSNVYHWTDQSTPSNRFMRPTDKDYAPLYAKWTQTVTLNANTSYHGSGSNTTATIVYKATAKSSITHCTPATGYQLEGYYSAATGGTKILNADGSFAGDDIAVSTDGYIVDGAWVHAGNTTLYAHYTAKTYDVILDVNGATSGSNQTVVATFDAAMPTTQKTSGAAITAPSKTGYTFGGYYANNTGTGTQYYTNALASNHIWDVATNNTHIYAKWTANPYTITLTQSGETGYGSAGTASVTATYDAALPTISSLPTAANGYAFMGYYTGHNGTGTQYYGADGTKLVATYTTADGLELFAYFKKAEVTEISFSPAAVVAPNTTITATPTISPTPTGTHIVCWEVQYSNGTALPSQPTFTDEGGNAVSFEAPAASATYRLQATLKTGSSCGGGTELCVYSTTFQVAGEHTVTVRYQDGSGRTLKDTIHITGKPLEWTTLGDITPPTITGYKFDHWDAGDGVTIKNGESTTTTTTTSSIQIKAVYDGTLTAVYAKKRLIFFNNTLGWSHVYVYFYKNDSYWESTGDKRGSGANGTFPFTSYPFSENYWGEMTQIEGTNIYYFDAEKKGVNASYDDVVFTKDNQYGYDYFSNTKAVRRGDYNSSKLPMFVPLADQTPATHNNTKYYNSGYWMNYPENTGYSLLIYNQKAKDGATKLYEIPFEFTEDYTMPMELTVDLEAGQTYGFEIKRADGTYYSTTTTITANTSNWGLYKNQTSYCGLQTTAAGDYTFSLFYDGEYRVGVTYPVAVNDYRIVYTDLATWSKDAHTASWNHPSGVITKNSSATEVKKDTVSFFWSYGSTPAIKYQKCTGTGTGSVTWNAGTAIDVSGFSSVLTKKGVYNFIFEQPAGGASISLVGVEPYTGNYYIRTDCAGSTKWANFSSMDHQMTYSDYAEEHSGYSHYYAQWVTSGTNVKFCIANDYSMCITDTLVEDKGTVIANITAEGNANAGRLNSGNASIRFMWDYKTNKVSRAYISGSTNVSDRFLVLEGDSKMYDKDGSALSISGLNPNEANLIDDQNFVYEREIQVNTKARAKLTAKYNSNIQYFKGGPGSTAADSVELLGGDASGKHTMRIVYDFKTNRLVTAYVPSGTINDDIAINADLMIVREHQGAGQQLLFEGEGALSEVHTVYGVMRFNRWTLNNKETTGSHDPVGDPKSAYERALYWISFPFDVNLSDVFGFGTYGTHWIIMEYDGAERASKGYWADSKGFWKYITNRTNKVLEAGKGYVLALDLDLMKYNDATFWSNNIEQVELFFPSAAEVNNISETNVQTTVDSHECTINRHTQAEQDAGTDTNINKNRTKADSHWNMIGIPSYANYGTTLKDGEEGSTITWNSNPYTNDLPFLYEWNMVDNTYTVQSGTTYPFKSMHAYMVQYHGNLYWSLASATPVSPIVARRTYADKPQNIEMRIELQQNEKAVDQTFVKLSNDENVSTNFAFDEDLCKEYNANKANIYTIVENYLPVAGNTLPMSDQTTVVPVGIKIASTGDYTFAIPEGTNGVGVTLIDNETGVRTSLSALDYTINLPAGTYNERFLLEISPIRPISTDLENTEYRIQNTDVRKVLIDGILYIVKDGVMYDARGNRVQ